MHVEKVAVCMCCSEGDRSCDGECLGFVEGIVKGLEREKGGSQSISYSLWWQVSSDLVQHCVEIRSKPALIVETS